MAREVGEDGKNILFKTQRKILRQIWPVIANAVERSSRFMTENHPVDLSIRGYLLPLLKKFQEGNRDQS